MREGKGQEQEESGKWRGEGEKEEDRKGRRGACVWWRGERGVQTERA